MTDKRQYIATHRATGEQTVVVATNQEQAAVKAGYRYVAECDVVVVPRGQEYALPFDTVPMIIRRANARSADAA